MENILSKPLLASQLAEGHETLSPVTDITISFGLDKIFLQV